MTLSTQLVPPAGTHGGDGVAVATALGIDPDDVVDLSQTLNPFGPDVAALIDRHAGSVRRYPDPAVATRLLADLLGIDSERLLLTNGGSEAIALVAAELGGRPRSEPDFALYPRRSSGPVWRSDPHSPTGDLADPDEHADIWDEAFYPLTTARWTAARPGVTVGSLTKLFACPGLRLGYLVADDVARFARHQPAWAVSTLALEVLPDLLAAADLTGWVRRIGDAKETLATACRQRNFTVHVPAAPWVLVDAPGLRDALAPLGVVIRDCASFGMPGTMRIAVPAEDWLNRLSAALDRVVEQGVERGVDAIPAAGGR